MEAIILAGGFGTRLRSVVSDVPKPMAPVAGKPFLEILLNSLSHKGFTRAILALGYKADSITNHFGNRYANIDLHYVIEDTPLGTGGAVRAAIEKATQDHVFIFNGDTYLDIEASTIEQNWQQSPCPKIVGCMVSDTGRYGRLIIDGNRVTGFSEKGERGEGLINAGCYVLPKKELDEFKVGENFSLETDFIVPNIAIKRFEVVVTHGKFIDIGVPEDYARAQTELANL